MTEMFEDKLGEWIELNGFFDGAGRVLLAVSGGADSVAMTYALHQLQTAGRVRCEFVIGHVNHGLRGSDSDGDEAFVKELGRKLNINVVAKSVPVREYAAEQKVSIETAGRVLRLQSLAAMAVEKGCAAVATAHHADDQAETVIHRLMRGTGFRGLCGIRPVSLVYGAKFIRPLLNVRRSQIVKYCNDRGIGWRHDVSNAGVRFMRNRIRHRLLPKLEAENKAIVDHLAKLAQTAGRFLERVEGQAETIAAKGRLEPDESQFCIDRGELSNCPPWVFYELMRGVLVQLGAGLRDYNRGHFELMRKMLGQKTAKADFPNGVRVVADKRLVSIRAGDNEAVSDKRTYERVRLPVGGEVRFGQWQIASKLLDRSEVDFEAFLGSKDGFAEWFDADAIVGVVEVRCRKDGDRFRPIGAPGEKKVGRFLMDAGLDAEIRRDVFVVADAERILWVAPVRMAEQVKVTSKTQRILEIRVEA